MKKSAYEKVTECVLELLEQGTCPWRRPWSEIEPPQNFISKKAYRGINLFLLGSMTFSSPYFMTYKQASEGGGNVRKGEGGSQVYFWGSFEPKGPKPEDEKGKSKFFLKYYTVFNADQVEGVEFPEVVTTEPRQFDPIEAAEDIIAGWDSGPPIEHGSRSATYTTVLDLISMPEHRYFDTEQEYYSTLFHELGHSTGHPRRLNRDMKGRFGSESYSKEELIAEMTSAYLCAACGIDNDVIENQAAYLRGWMGAIKKDSRLLVTAASQARKAADLILGESESKEATIEKKGVNHEHSTRAYASHRQR